MDLPIMASLWIGGSLSYIEQVCLKSFVDHGHRMILYTYGDVGCVPPGVEVMDANLIFPNDNYIVHAKSGSPAVHADAFRYRMIELQNVVWVDADILCMRPWDFKDQWIFGWEKPDRLVCNAVLGLPRFSKTLAKLNDLCRTEYPIPPWADDATKAEYQRRHDAGDPVHVSEMEWGVWGPAAVTHFLFETGEMQYVQPQMAFYPISFRDRRDLITSGTMIEDQLTDGCYGVHLWNRRLRRRLVTNEGGFAPKDSYLGRKLIEHQIDPETAPIPDTPPADLLAEVAEKTGAPVNVDPFAYLKTGKPFDAKSWLAAHEKGAVPAPKKPAVAEDDEDDGDTTASTNPNVVPQRPKAMDELQVMPSVQSPEYQTIIDGLEGRTSGITGYLKDPEEPIDNSKILVVTSMKNEAPFILEWVAYHKAIGVDHFLVYTNDCTDNTNEMLDRLVALGHVTRVPNPWNKESGKKPQHVALKDALRQPVYQAANWILTIDCDEFVNIHVGDGTFDDLFRAANYPNVVSFTWKFFGNKDIHGYVDKPITEQFVNCAPEFIPKPRLGWGFKSMFHKSSPYTRIGVHRPLGIDDGEEDQVRWVNGSGRAMPDMLLTNNGWRSTKRSVGYRLATLNHYILRSAESFLVKRDRGRINHTEHDQGIDYWMRRNYATEVDDRIHARLPMMRAVLDDFHADPVLGKLHTEAVAWHEAKIKTLLDNPDYKQLFDDLTKVARPDALDIAKDAEAAEAAAEEEAREARAASKPKMPYTAPEPLRTLRLVGAPGSAATEPVHEAFNDARAFAGRNQGFMWEGEANAMMFAPRSKRLVVTFDNLHSARQEGQRWPWGMKALYQDLGCSVLGALAVQRNWYRDDFVHDSFEALRDQKFFDQFDEILFYGTSMGGFAALVYQAVAPGSRVLAIAPQSTLDRAILPDDDRWGWTAKLDWTGRFNDAAKEPHLAEKITIIADPYFQPDYDQVSRIKGDNITWLKTPFMGHQLPNAFHVMDILKDILGAGVGGTLTPALFYKLFRARRDLPRFQHDLLMEAERRGKLKSAIRVCEYTLKKRKAKNIERSLERLREELAAQSRPEAAE
jgi:hypothetical protein